jgi:hypothetical protein
MADHGDKVMVGVWFEPDDLNEIDDAVVQFNTSRSAYIRKVLKHVRRNNIDDQIPPDEFIVTPGRPISTRRPQLAEA